MKPSALQMSETRWKTGKKGRMRFHGSWNFVNEEAEAKFNLLTFNV